MRIFSDIEKKLLRRIIELDAQEKLLVLNNIIWSLSDNSYIPPGCYIAIKSKTDVEIKIVENSIDTVDRINDIEASIFKNLLTIITLFEYFEEQKLVYFVGDFGIESLGEKIHGESYISGDFIDDDLKPIIYKYANNRMFISESLRVFVENDFKTDEEIRRNKEVEEIERRHNELIQSSEARHRDELAESKRISNNEVISAEKKMKSTQISLYISLFAVLCSIFVPIFVTSAIDIKNDKIITELNSKSMDDIKKIVVIGLDPLAKIAKDNHVYLKTISKSIMQSNKVENKNSERITNQNCSDQSEKVNQSDMKKDC